VKRENTEKINEDDQARARREAAKKKKSEDNQARVRKEAATKSK
jgi:hypothetical protein